MELSESPQRKVRRKGDVLSDRTGESATAAEPDETQAKPLEQVDADAGTGDEDEDVEEEEEETEDPHVVSTVETYSKMLRDIRTWGQMLLLFGVINIIGTSLLSAPYGVMLLIVALSSFYFRESPMYVVYAVTLAWAAISNFLSSSGIWMGFGVLQLLLAWQVFQGYRRYRGVEAEYRRLAAQGEIAEAPAPQRAARFFPALGCLVSAAALLGVIAIVLVFFAALVMETNVPDAVDFGIGLVANLAMLGLAAGVAALASRFQHKVLAALGVAASLMVVLLWLAVMILIRAR